MKKKEVQLNFRIKIENFYSVIKARIGFMRRDKDEFVKYGISEDKINDVDNELEVFAEIPTDDELVGAQVQATQEKDTLAEKVRDTITGIMTRVINKYGTGSGYYRKFGVNGISNLTLTV